MVPGAGALGARCSPVHRPYCRWFSEGQSTAFEVRELLAEHSPAWAVQL